MVWNDQSFRGVCATSIQHENGETVRIGRCHGVYEDLKVGTVAPGQTEKEVFARRWRYRTIQVEALEYVLTAPNGLHTACGQAAAAYRQQAEAARILSTHFHRTVRGIGACCLQLSKRRRLQCLSGISVFCVWLGRGTLSVAWNLVRTRGYSVVYCTCT